MHQDPAGAFTVAASQESKNLDFKKAYEKLRCDKTDKVDLSLLDKL